MLGIQQLPEVSKQRKHNVEDLNVDSDDENDSSALISPCEDPFIKKSSSRTKRKINGNVTKDKSSKKSKQIRSENVVTAVHECKDCKLVFTRVDSLRRHMQNKLPNQTRPNLLGNDFMSRTMIYMPLVYFDSNNYPICYSVEHLVIS